MIICRKVICLDKHKIKKKNDIEISEIAKISIKCTLSFGKTCLMQGKAFFHIIDIRYNIAKDIITNESSVNLFKINALTPKIPKCFKPYLRVFCVSSEEFIKKILIFKKSSIIWVVVILGLLILFLVF